MGINWIGEWFRVFKIGDKIVDKNEIIGVVKDLDLESKGFEIGVVFEGEEDNGVWWCNKEDLKLL